MLLRLPFVESTIWSESSPFQCLPERVEPKEVADVGRLRTAFERVLRSEDANAVRNLVIIWTVANPYRHSEGKRELSRVVYIEKTAGTIRRRWTRRYIHLLADGADAEEARAGTDLRWLANHASNGQFYRTLIAAHGPLQVWWADVDRLNQASADTLTDALNSARKWEQLLLAGYRQQHGCLPLKNRRG